MKNRPLYSLFLLFLTTNILAQVRISEVSREMVTYPFDNPNPVPEFGTIYPYFRFDGYAASGENKTWKMIEMENDFIKLWITPEIGGKIWGAIDKATGKEFLYFNHVVKFRDIAMRGPWTSGGLEINFGVIGHAPTCSAPVDYFIRMNADSSISCFIGALDLPSRTEWRVEVLLPKDRAGFETNALWYNGNPWEQSYYQWMNAGVKSAGNLEYAYPGKYSIDHDGRNFPYPVDARGREISFYEKNNFGPAKSYHVAGTYTDFFGGYWHDDDFGFGHFSEYSDKPGKKIWIWGLARNGMIWEDLLTDSDGQYSEIQSGRLFNQSGPASTLTPFKHRSFNPYASDIWKEFWFPVKGMRGLIYGTDDLSFNIREEAGDWRLYLYASGAIEKTLKVIFGNNIVAEEPLNIKTGESKIIRLPAGPGKEGIVLTLDDEIFYSSGIHDARLNRPFEMPAGFNFESASWLYLEGKEWERQRYFARAKTSYTACLDKDPFFVPALNGLAGICIRELRPQEAFELTKTALAVDTYDPASNYYYGLANSALGNTADALDGFSIAAQSPEYRVAAHTQLAIHFLRDGSLEKASGHVRRSLLFNRHNILAMQMAAILARLQERNEEAHEKLEMILRSDPLNHLARFEKYLLNSSPGNADEFKKYIRNELPQETYIELAVLYYNLGRNEDAIRVLELAPEHAMVEVWNAYLNSKLSRNDQAVRQLEHAASLSPEMVFPFRQEDADALRWAVTMNSSWKFKYYSGLALANLSHREEALGLLNSCGDHPDFWPFYSTRAGLNTDEAARERDLTRASGLSKDWRPILELAKFYGNKNAWDKANALVEPYFKDHSDNYYAGLYLARCFLNLGRHSEGINLMAHLKVLPNEGASEGRETWRAMQLNAATQAMGKNNYKTAIKYLESAKLWPENLGVGRPYDVDERLEDYLLAICYEKSRNAAKAKELLTKAIAPIQSQNYQPSGSSDLASALALRKSGKNSEAENLLHQWMKESPQDKRAGWSMAMFNGKPDAAAKILSESGNDGDEITHDEPREDPLFIFIVKNKEILFGD
ncbi:MAG TPA: DUF5107 domain-containing protein [Cyclobacteriaceae bacterium]|nr:DUF5107 domain-containing protein [Cyclobacteriaceae bacterium]